MVAALSLFFALILLSVFCLQKSQADKVAKWPSVTGVVDSVKIATGHSRSSTYYYQNVTYKYDCNKQPFENNTIAFNSTSRHYYSKADAVNGKYHQGDIVSVYYDPGHPASSCLDNANTSFYYQLWWSIVFMVVAAVTPFLPNRSNSEGYDGRRKFANPF